ncbi:hypothetical protein BDZ88DRAFT_477741 [Geranomyces variabilis]|nr:hypothetical protein BDZ88DRAFT_477741 [Geranomyces variabilis]KAJ3133602.1 Nephrocystin-4 [Geranomyces variabilis]
MSVGHVRRGSRKRSSLQKGPTWLDWFLANCPSIDYQPGQQQKAVGGPLTKVDVPYQLTVHSVEGPSSAGSKRFQLRASFFDAETNCFYGRTRVVKASKRRDTERASSSDESLNRGVQASVLEDSATLKDQTLFFHTTQRSKHHLIVLEIVHLDGRDGPVTAGWTFLRPFASLDARIDRAGRRESELEHFADMDRIIPIYSGTPRVLPLLSAQGPLGVPATSLVKSLVPIPGASITYSFRSRPDMRAACALWKPNVMIGRTDSVPGLKISSKGRVRTQGVIAVVSEILVRFPFPHEDYTDMLLAAVHAAHKNHHPQPKRSSSLTRSLSRSRSNQPPTLPPPLLVERRLHIGLHNSHTFVHDPIVINLDTTDDDETTCCVRGALELERFTADPRMALVVAVEYRVRVPCLCAESEGGLFGKKTIVGPGEGVERGFMVGWGWWVPSHKDEQSGKLELSSEPGDNPFMTPMYRSNSDSGLVVSLNFDARITDHSSVVESPIPQNASDPPHVERPTTVDAITSPIVQSDAEPEPPAVPRPMSRPITPIPKPVRRSAPLTPPPLSTASAAIPISRMHLARLHDAGFPPPPVNDDGSLCKYVDFQSEKNGNVAALAYNDKFPGAEVEVCFMAVALLDELSFNRPKRVYFSYSIHAQPCITTEPLFVHTGPVPVKGQQNAAEEAWPGILWSMQSDRQPAYGRPPGLTDTYRTSADVLRPYLATRSATIDIFDGDTHQFLGTSGLTFDALVDGGRVAEGSVEILHGTGLSCLSIGHLFLRVAHVRRRDVGVSVPESLKKTHSPGTVWPRKMIVVDPELRALLQTETSAITSGNQLDVETHRKTQRARRIAAAAEWPSADLASGAVIPYTQSRAQLLANLHTTHTVRSRVLRAAIRKRLARGITNREPVRVSFGRAQCIPFLVSNPYTSAATFVILWSDADVRAVLPPGGAEAAYLGRCMAEDGLRWNKGDAGAVVEHAEGRVKVFLNPGEECCIPFVVQSFLPGGDGSPGPVARNVDIEFSCAKTQTVLAILKLELIPTPFVVTRHDRLYVGEKEVVRHTIRGSIGTDTGGAAAIYDARNPAKLYVRCHDPDVLCEIAEDGNTNTQTLTFKHNSRAAMSVYTLYFLLYNDPYHTSLRETWRCVIHTLSRAQISSVLGQPTSAAVVVRGGTCSRAVNCCVDRMDIVTVMRSSPLVLTANSLNEIPLLVRPKDVGTQQAILNVVDADTNRLHSSYLLQMHTTAPRITKAFTLTVPRHSSQSKRISYTNPYSHAKRFSLHTPTPHLLAFVHDELELGPGETGYIGLRLLASSGPSSMEDVMVMLNDEEGRVEECLGLRIMYE